MALRSLLKFRFVTVKNIYNHSSLRLVTTSRIATSESTVKEANTKESVTDDTYKVQEYFNYNENSFYDLECDLEKHRLEQPSPTEN